MNGPLWNPFSQATSNITSATATEIPRGNNVASRGAALWKSNSSPYGFPDGMQPYTPNSSPHSSGGFYPRFSNQTHHRFQNNQRFSSHRGGRFNDRGFQPRQATARNVHSDLYCEACELEFRNPRLFDEHVERHLKCPKCQFVGLIEAVEQHYEVMHLAAKRKACEPQTPEELEKWRKERSKKFPRSKKSGEESTEDKQSATGSVLTSSENPLGNLMEYGETSESEPEEMPSKPEVSAVISALKPNDDEQSVIPTSSAAPRAHPSNASRGSRGRPVQRRHPMGQPVVRKPRTLYEKLCARDAEADADRIFQCISYVSNKGFLQ